MRAAAIPPIVLAAAALAPGGCGSTSNNAGKFSGAQKDVAQTIDDLASDARSRDAKKICDELFTPALARQLATLATRSHRGGGKTCADQLKDSLQDADSLDVTVLKGGITITGNQATVRFKTNVSQGQDPIDTLHLVNAQGWRIDRLP